MKRRDSIVRTLLVAAAFIAAMLAAGCSMRDEVGAFYDGATDKDGVSSLGFEGRGFNAKGSSRGEVRFATALKMVAGDAEPAPESAADVGGNAAPSIQNQSRKLVKTGSVSVEAKDMAEAEKSARALAEKLGGYVASSNNYQQSLSMVLRVPQGKFAEAMEGAAGIGRTLARSESVEDVSLRYADLASRIESKKILRDRYKSYLKTASKVEDLLAVERSLNEVLSELDSMESQFRVLADEVDYATVSFDARLPPEALPASERSFLGGLTRIWDAFKGFLYVVVFVIIGIVLFGVPALLLLGLLYWVCFGKIGLVRKFFRLLSRKKGQGAAA